MAETAQDGDGWSAAAFDVLQHHDVRHVAYVPDSGLSRLIARAGAEPDVEATLLTTEEEGIGYLCGAWLGGQRGVLLMQSSGVGNCVNTLGLVQSGRFPLLMVVTMRGEWAEFNPWQVPMGRVAAPALELMGAMTYRVDQPAEVADTLDAAAELAFAGDQAVAVLLSQRLIGRKTWTK